MNNSAAKSSTAVIKAGYWVLWITIWVSLVPASAWGQFQNLMTDARTVPWSTINRLALEGGTFPPAHRPASSAEIVRLLEAAQQQARLEPGSPLTDQQEASRLQFLLDRYQHGGGYLVWDGPDCLPHPPHLRLSGRIVGGYSELGNPVPLEGGLSFPAGHNLFLEPTVEFVAGAFWSAVALRSGGRVAEGGIDFGWPGGDADPLTWNRWPLPTGRSAINDARLKDGAWHNQITRAVVGMQLGNWALSAGWDHRRSGPGLTGDLNLDYQGRPFPAVTARRTRSFRWSGFMTHLAPDQTLLRAGLLSRRTVDFSDIYGTHTKEANPYFFQWLVGWNVTSWFRTNFTHTVIATAREGTLWPDLLQVNFPVIGTTWREMDSGPITDRIFAAQMEFRWRKAPWPLLPASAGRIFWDYGGTDFLPSGPGGLIPQISVPASVAGIELLSPRWDLGFEYAELQHPLVLWYSNGGYKEGYSQEHWLLGHPLGGSGESFTGLVRLRPTGWDFQAKLQGQLASWGMSGYSPGTGERQSLGLTLSRTPRSGVEPGAQPGSPLLWEITAEWNREKADPNGYVANPTASAKVIRDWWRVVFKLGI